MADETVVLGIKVDSTQIEKAGIKLDELKRSASGAEKATDGLTNGYKDLKATLDPVFAVQRQYQSGLKIVREEQKRGNLSLEEATRTTALLTKRYELLTNQINGTGKSFRKLRGAAGNIGFQLQDIAVQAQAGTDAFIIFSQQGSQLASAFGPGGAVLGAVIAIAGALGGVLVNSLNDAKEETEKLTGAAKEMQDELESVFQGLASVQARKLTGQIQELESRINSIQEEIRITPNIELVKRDELGRLREALMLLREQREEVLGPIFTGPEDDVDEQIEAVKEYTNALKFKVDMLGKSATAIELEKAKRMGANQLDLIEIKGLLDKIDAHEAEEVARKKAAKEAEKAYKSLVKGINEAIKAQEKEENQLQDLINQLDPVRAKLAKLTEQILTLRAANEGGKYDTLIAKLEEDLNNIDFNPDDTGGEFLEAFMKGVDGIGDALQSAIMSGDFAGVGNAVGGILANSMANAVQASVGGLAGSVLGGVAGGIVGSAVTGLIDGLIDEINDPTEARQRSQGAGTILGSIDEKSQSIANSNELIANATGELVGISNGMLTQLSILSGSISDVSARVMQSRQGLSFQAPEMQNLFGGDDIQSGLAGQAIAGSVLDAVLPGLGAILSAGARSKQVDEGIRIIGGQIQDVIDNTVIEGFASFEVKKNFLDDYDRKDRFVTLGDEINTQFGQIFSGIVDTVVEGVGVLGVSRDQVMTALDDFLIETQMISLEGLDAAAQEAAIQSVFSKIFDQVSKEVIGDTLPFLNELADGGEGLGETLTRVTTQFLSVKEAAVSLGFGFIGTTENLIRASDSLIERVGGLEAFSSAVLSFEKNFLSTEDQLSNQSRRLNDALSAIGEELPETRQGFADLVTGLRHVADVDEEALAILLQLGPEAASYYSLLEQSLEDTGSAIDDVVDIVGRLEDAVASAATGVDSALSGLKASIDAEKAELEKQYRELVEDRKESLADELKMIKDSGSARVDAIKDAEKERLKSLTGEKDLIKAVEKTRLKSVSGAKDLIKEEEKARLKGNKIALDAVKNGLRAVTSELDAITSAIAKLQEKSISTEMRRVKAFALLQKAVATGDLTGAGDAASIASNISQGEFSTGADFRRQMGLTNTLLGQASALGSMQKSNAERSVEALEAQSEAIKQSSNDQIKALDVQSEVIKEKADQQINKIDNQIDLTKMLADDAIEKAKIETENAITAAKEISELELAAMEGDHEASIARLDTIVLEAQNQIDALRDIDSSVKSVEEAVAAFGSAINAERQARQALEQQLATQEQPPTATKPFGITLRGTPSTDVAPEAGQIATFADGGTHGGGLRIVGEEGPELEMTGPSRIMSNNDLSKMLSNDEMAAEIKRMREELNRVLMSIARSSGKTAKRLDRWEGDGLPNFREPQEVV